MNFTFLHAADLHLGSPFQGLALRDENIAMRFAGASRAAFEELIDRALAEKIAFAIFAGDIFDGEWRDAAIALFFNRQIGRLANAGIPSYLLKGNHDADSVVTKSLSLPDLARQFPTAKPGSFEIADLRVALHGRGFAQRAASDNYALAYPEARPGWFNIGVLHSSLDGRPGHAAYAPCSVSDLCAKNYDYWALGHVHAYEEVSHAPWIVYPGNLQGRSIRETGAKGAVFVDVADGLVAQVRRIVTDKARFGQIVVDASHFDENLALLREIETQARDLASEAEGRLLALRVKLTGAAPLHGALAADPQFWRDEIEAAAQRGGEDIWLEKLVAATLPAATASSGLDFDFAAQLDECLVDAALREQAIAALAQIESKFGSALLRDDIDALLTEARDMALARAQGDGRTSEDAAGGRR